MTTCFKTALLICCAFLLITGCIPRKGPVGDHPLARVADKYLYQSDLVNIVPKGTGVKDSMVMVQNYIDSWIREELILDIAKKNLLPEDIRFEKQLEEYKNSLIIYEYESKLVQQNLDTVVSDYEIESYFNDNIENFRLKTNIVRAVYARFLNNEKSLNRVKRFFRSSTPGASDSLEVYFINHAETYNFNDEKWIPFDDLLRFVPVETNNKEAFLRNNKKVELEDDHYHYFLSLTAYKLIDELPPLGFEMENIRQIILNQRKLKYIRNMREEIFSTAMQNNDFEIY
ncbi:MAG: hypothetical protein JXA03_01600 [Bacteroidales bacterium]|nr:hypothetical protein [Bacteroidales bacterium]